MENFEKKERKASPKNLFELEKFLGDKFGDYSWLIGAAITVLSGIKDSRDLPRDKEERKRIKEEALKSTLITSEIIEQVNAALQGVVNLNKSEIDHYKNKEGREKYLEDCQKVVDVLGNKKLLIDENGDIKLEENLN